MTKLPETQKVPKVPKEHKSKTPLKSRTKVALTGKQEDFCQCVVSGLDFTDSYLKAYGANDSKENVSRAYINNAAYLLSKQPKIIARIAELKAPIAKAAGISLADHIQELQTLRDLAKGDKKWTAAIQAEMACGKVCGLYVDKVLLGNPEGESFKVSQDLSGLTTDELATLMAIRDKIDSKDKAD